MSLNIHIREQSCREPTPSLGCVDGEYVKNSSDDGEKEIDGNKKINGLKRQVMVDTFGIVWACSVHAANLSDTVMDCALLDKITDKILRLEKILLDGGYKGSFIKKGKNKHNIFCRNYFKTTQ